MLPMRIALADLLGERRMSICTALAVAAVLAPLLVLAALRAGAVEGMRETVLRDPLAREVMSIANASFDRPFLERLRGRADVLHLSPRTRQLSASLLLDNVAVQRTGWVQVIPSAEGDPLPPPDSLTAPEQIVLSATAAAKMGVAVGAKIVGRLGREKAGQRESLAIDLTVAAIAAPSASDRDTVFVQVALASGLEDWTEGRGDAPAMGAPPVGGAREAYAGFRLYARAIEEVPGLVTELRAQGIETRSRMQDIAPMLAIDRALTRLLAAIGGMSTLGLVLSLGVGLWANVERKRRLLAGLRLMGFGRAAVMALPMIQAATLAMIGVVLASAAALLVAAAINTGLAGLALDRPLVELGAPLLLVAGFGCVGVAVLASALAAWQAAAIEPYEAVRGP